MSPFGSIFETYKRKIIDKPSTQVVKQLNTTRKEAQQTGILNGRTQRGDQQKLTVGENTENPPREAKKQTTIEEI